MFVAVSERPDSYLIRDCLAYALFYILLCRRELTVISTIHRSNTILSLRLAVGVLFSKKMATCEPGVKLPFHVLIAHGTTHYSLLHSHVLPVCFFASVQPALSSLHLLKSRKMTTGTPAVPGPLVLFVAVFKNDYPTVLCTGNV